MNWKNKKVLVTGAAGFIGSHLVEKLAALKADVSCLVRYNSMNNWGWIETSKAKLNIVTGNLCDSDCVRKAVKDKDIVFHLGAIIPIPYSYVNPRDVVQTNVLGTLNVLEAVKEYNVDKLINTSTSETYGTAQYVPIDEKHPCQGQSPYAASKIAADKIAESFFYSYNTPVTTVRPFNTYGPRQSARAIIPTIITQLLDKKQLKLGNVHPTRDFTFVRDCAEAFVKIAESNTLGETINIGTNSEISIGELAEKIMDLVGTKVKLDQQKERVRKKGSEVERLVADNTKAKKLGWKPQTSLTDGLKETIEWLKENISLYKTDMYNI